MSTFEPFTSVDLALFRAIASTLSEVYSEAATRSGAELIPAAALAGHELGSPHPWVYGGPPLSSPYHPNADGMRAVADRVLELIAR